MADDKNKDDDGGIFFNGDTGEVLWDGEAVALGVKPMKRVPKKFRINPEDDK